MGDVVSMLKLSRERKRLIIFLALLASARLQAQVELKTAVDDHVSININGQEFSEFCFGAAYPMRRLMPSSSAIWVQAVSRAIAVGNGSDCYAQIPDGDDSR